MSISIFRGYGNEIEVSDKDFQIHSLAFCHPAAGCGHRSFRDLPLLPAHGFQNPRTVAGGISTRRTGEMGESVYWYLESGFVLLACNERDIHAAYLFNSAGRPDFTQKWVRMILENKYGAGYDGEYGGDDAGTISAWYVFSALGFYPVAGSDVYQIGAPLFPKTEIKMGEKVLTVVAQNYAPGNLYVKNVSLNGRVLDCGWLKHAEIADGGILVFEMSEKHQTK